MEIVIKAINEENLGDANQCHAPFMVESSLVVTIEHSAINCLAVPVAPYPKQYPPNEIEYAAYIDNAEKVVYFAYVENRIAGELVMRRWWNNFAYIEDLSVAAKFRRNGIGRALVRHAIRWGKDAQLRGVMLETQNNNVAACRLYETCGFTLGGFDKFLYRALYPDTSEIALYWYFLFDQD